MIVRPLTRLRLYDRLGEFRINVAFLSAAGIDWQRRATCAAFHEARIKQKAISLARESCLVVDSSKVAGASVRSSRHERVQDDFTEHGKC